MVKVHVATAGETVHLKDSKRDRSTMSSGNNGSSYQKDSGVAYQPIGVNGGGENGSSFLYTTRVRFVVTHSR
jgi:hypothetical protein